MKPFLAIALAGSAAVLTSSSPALAAPAQKFLFAAAQGNASEVMLGQEIARLSSSPRVRQFGQMLVRDHGKGLREVDALAARMHLRVPHTIAIEARTEDLKLRKLRGRDFDAEVKRYMIFDHEKDISDFTDQSRGGERMTAAFANKTLPVLNHHLEMAKSL
jgi:putative membrane protein